MFILLRHLAKFAAELPSLVRESTTQRSVDHQDEKTSYEIETYLCPTFEHEIATW